MINYKYIVTLKVFIYLTFSFFCITLKSSGWKMFWGAAQQETTGTEKASLLEVKKWLELLKLSKLLGLKKAIGSEETSTLEEAFGLLRL